MAVDHREARFGRASRRTPHPLFLWRFEADASRVYLAGSIHVMKASLFPLPTQFEAAFDARDRMAVEVDTNALDPGVDPAEIPSDYALLPAGQSLGTVLQADHARRRLGISAGTVDDRWRRRHDSNR